MSTRARPAPAQQLSGSSAERHQRIGIEHRGRAASSSAVDELPAARLAAEPGSDDHRVGPCNQVEERAAGGWSKRLGQGLEVRLRLHQRGDGVRRAPPRAPSPAPAAKAARAAIRTRAAHACVSTDHHHAAAVALVVSSPEPAQPLAA